MGLGGRAGKWRLTGKGTTGPASDEVAQGGVQGSIEIISQSAESQIISKVGSSGGDGSDSFEQKEESQQQPEEQLQSSACEEQGQLSQNQDQLEHQNQQEKKDSTEMPSKPLPATVHEVQPLINDAGAVVVIEAASKLGGDVGSTVTKYRSVGPGDGAEREGSVGREEKPFLSPFIRQVLAAAGPVMATVSSGMTSGFSAVLLPQLAAKDSLFPITEEESSWIASTAALPMAPGCLLGGLLMEKFGRRLTIILLCIPFALGWALESAAPDVLSLCLGRALTGLAVGLLGAPGMVYIGETSSPANRGFLLAAVSLAVSLGVALSHLIGALLYWRTAAGLAAAVPLMAAILAFLSPESPLWLASRGKTKEAVRVFRMLRGTGLEAEKELEALVSRSEAKTNIRLQQITIGNNDKRAEAGETVQEESRWSRWLHQWGNLLRRPSFVKPFLIMNIFFFVQQWCGVNAVTFYTVDIFKATSNGKSGAAVNEYMATGLVDVARIVASVAACILLRKCGRRPLATASGVISALSLLALAGFLSLGSKPEDMTSLSNNTLTLLSENSTTALLQGNGMRSDPSSTIAPFVENTTSIIEGEIEVIAEEAVDLATHALAWAPVLCLILYVLASSVGLIPLPWVMTGEVFPVAGRGLGSGVTSCVGFLAFFSVVKTAPALFRELGMGGAFCVYGVVVLIGTGVLHLCLPETKGKTLQEIEEAFGGSKLQKKKEDKRKEAEGGEDGEV